MVSPARSHEYAGRLFCLCAAKDFVISIKKRTDESETIRQMGNTSCFNDYAKRPYTLQSNDVRKTFATECRMQDISLLSLQKKSLAYEI